MPLVSGTDANGTTTQTATVFVQFQASVVDDFNRIDQYPPGSNWRNWKYRFMMLQSAAPIAYWTCDDASGILQDFKNPTPVKMSPDGSPLYRQPTPNSQKPYGWGFRSPTANDTFHVTNADSAAMAALGDVFSVEMWFQRIDTDNSVLQYLCSKQNSGCAIAITTSGTIQFFIPGGGSTLATSSVAVNDTLSHHVVCTKNGVTSKIYLDGVDVTVAGTNQTADWTANYSFFVGADPLFPGQQARAVISDVALYSTAITLNRAIAHWRGSWFYEQVYNIATPTGFWGLGDVSGTVAKNIGSLGAAANGNYLGTYTLNQPGAIWNDRNGSVALGASGRIEIPSGVTLGHSGGNGGVSAWIYPTAAVADDVMIFGHANAAGTGNQPVCVAYGPKSGSGQRLWAGFFNGTTWTTVADTTDLPLNAWTHIHVIYDTNIKLYRNGILVGGPVATTGRVTTPTTTQTYIGRHWSNLTTFPGMIDEVIYSTSNSTLFPTWTYTAGAGGPSVVNNQFQIRYADTGNTYAEDPVYWITPDGPSLDQEVILTMNQYTVDGLLAGFTIGLRRLPWTNSYYQLNFQARAGTDSLLLQRVTNGSATFIGSDTTTDWQPGDKLGLRIKGTTITLVRWPAATGQATVLTTATDSNFQTPGYVSLGGVSQAKLLIADDFQFFGPTSLLSSDPTGPETETASVAIKNFVSDTDANGPVTESAAYQLGIPGSDSGTATETASVVVQAQASDNGTITETQTQPVAASDANGTTTEIANANVPVTGADAGSISEVTIVKALVSDLDPTGTETELATTSAKVASVDSGGIAAETTSISQPKSDSDLNGATTEANILSAQITGSAVSLTLAGTEITDATRASNVQGDGRASPDSSYGIWEATVNAITNGGFETNVTGWTLIGSTLTRITSDFKFGTACGQVVVANAVAAEGVWSGFTATAARWTVSAWVKAVSGTVRIAIRDNAGVDNTIGTPVTMDGTWKRITLTTPANLTAAVYRLHIETDVQQALTLNVDGVQAEAKVIATPYVNTNGATGSRSIARVQAPNNVLNAIQGWVAVRFRAGFPSAAPSAPFPTFFYWYDGTNAGLQGYISAGRFYFNRQYVATQHSTSIAVAWNVGDFVTVVMRWDPLSHGQSANGSAFANFADVSPPQIVSAFFELAGAANSANYVLDSDVFWAACGMGTLTDADAATLHAFGNNGPPSIASLPGGPSFYWPADVSTATTSEVGVVSETQSVTVQVPSSATNGVVTETALLTAQVSSVDAGTTSESAAFAAQVIAADSFTSTESVSGIALKSSDAGTETETALPVAQVSSVDAGTASDASSIGVPVSIPDTGIVSEVATVKVAVSSSDNGIVVEATTLTTITQKSDADSATLPAEGATVIAGAATGDVASSAESASVRVIFTTGDIATAAEVFALVAKLASVDSGGGTESAGANVIVISIDSGTLIDSAIPAKYVDDFAVGLDTEILHAQAQDEDFATMTEAYDRQPPLTLFTGIPAGVILAMSMGTFSTPASGTFRRASGTQGTFGKPKTGRILK